MCFATKMNNAGSCLLSNPQRTALYVGADTVSLYKSGELKSIFSGAGVESSL